MILDVFALKYLVNSKSFIEPTGSRFLSFNYSTDGDLLVSGCQDDTITVVNMITGTKNKSVNSKKYGVGIICFAKDTAKVMHTSAKLDHTIRFLELAGNKYLRYFQGHKAPVTSLSMSPLDELFISVAEDRTIRLWDTRSNNCQGLMNTDEASAIAAFDPEGLIFAVGLNSNMIKLYDLRSFDKGPFATFTDIISDRHQQYNWCSMKFSYCGKFILINTDGPLMMLVDAFSGELKHCFSGHPNTNRTKLEGSFSADSTFATCGGTDRCIYMWSVETGELVHRMQTSHEDTPHIVQFSPRHFSMASGCRKLNLWCASEDFKMVKAEKNDL